MKGKMDQHTDVTQLIETINTQLKSQADPAYRELIRTRYNMNVDNFWGVRTPAVHKVAGTTEASNLQMLMGAWQCVNICWQPESTSIR